MTNTSEANSAEKWRNCREDNYLQQTKYNRINAAREIGFSKKRGAFTEFLRSNYLICTEDIPNQYLLEKNFMSLANITLVNGSNKNIPLFTEKGIDYLKKMMNDPDFLSSEYNILKANLAPSSYQYCR